MLMRMLLGLFFVFLSCGCSSRNNDSKQKNVRSKGKVCLNMIVKDEKDVIRRCLDSVKEVIDYWVIVDTGSSDGTQKIIKQHMKGIPGELHQRPWKNWGETRSEAFELAKGKGDYILFMDADDVLEFEGDKKFPSLSADLYLMDRGVKGFTYKKPQLVKGDLSWKWVGVTHEYLSCDEEIVSDFLNNVKYVTLTGGATHKDPKAKFLKNIQLLEDGLKSEPNNARYAFYLAESYRDFGEKAKALECFQKRVKMGGWSEEVFWSKFQIARMAQEIGLPNSMVIDAYLDAHEYRPHRSEPIYYLAELYNNQREYSKAYDLIKAYESVEKPNTKDILFSMDWVDEYGLLFQLSVSSYYVGRYQESLDLCDQLILNQNLPGSWRERVLTNRSFPIEKLQKVAKK